MERLHISRWCSFVVAFVMTVCVAFASLTYGPVPRASANNAWSRFASVVPSGGIGAFWRANGWLGAPTGTELQVRGGASQTFEHGTVFWRASDGSVHAVRGAILSEYGSLGWEQSWLGFPVSEERALKGGASQSFEHGQIHWSALTGAHATRGAVQSYWSATGWENGWLGYPTGDELQVAGGVSQTFRGGTVFWRASGGATHGVRGAILSRYAALGWEQGMLGFPMSDENTGLRGGGAAQVFEHGQIHWSAATGAWETAGGIQARWSGEGWENGWLGYPTTSEHNVANGSYQSFQNGKVYWKRSNGATDTSTNAMWQGAKHRGSFCKPQGARGINDGDDHSIMICDVARDGRLRWQNL